MRAFTFALMVVVSVPAVADAVLERGAYLMKAVVACGNCHTQQTPAGPAVGMELAGGNVLVDDPRMTAQAPNITPASKVGDWSDAELKRAIREGVRPDGSIIGPPMPFPLYRHLSDEDLDAVVAYVRRVAPVEHETPASVYRIPLPPAWGSPVTGPVEAPSREDAAAYGAYIAGPLAHCTECHSTPDERGVPDPEHALGGGGLELTGPWGVSVAANITPTNLGDWTDAEIETAIRTGKRKDGGQLKPPMPFGYYANMTDADMKALIAYLRSLQEL